MKKQIRLLIIFSCLSTLPFSIFSQAPSISGYFIPPKTLKEFVTYFNPNGGLNEGDSGVGLNWDVSNYQNLYNTLIQHTDPKFAPHSADFPNASVVELRPLPGGDTIFTFHNIISSSNASNSILGTYQVSNKKLLVYIAPKILAEFKVGNNIGHFRDSISNSYSATGTFDSAGLTGTIKRHGVLKRFYDAYGAIKTPYHTYNDDGRVRLWDHYTDSITLNGKLTVHEIFETNFIWTQSADPLRHASITHTTLDGVKKDEGFFICMGCKVGIEMLNKKRENISIYPQPANDRIIIKLNMTDANEYKLILTDISGRILFTCSCESGKAPMEINTTLFASGVYLLKLCGAEQPLTEKLMITH